MKNKTKYYIYNIINFFDKKKITYLILGLVLSNLYCILDTKTSYDIDYNLIFDFNNKFYLCMLLLLSSFFVLNYLNKYKNKIELITRFKNKQQYFQYIVKCIVFITLFISVLNFGVLFILRMVRHNFSFSISNYYLYDIPTPLYLAWQFIRNYIYVLFINYIIAFLNFHTVHKGIIYSFYIIIVLLLLIPIGNFIDSNIAKILIFSTFLSYYNFESILNEILFFICSFTIKFYLIYLLIFIIRKWKQHGKN